MTGLFSVNRHPSLFDHTATDEFREDFASLCFALREFEKRVVPLNAESYTTGQLVVAGLIGHAFQCCYGFFLSWQNELYAGAVANARMISEIIATNCYLLEKPDRVVAAYNDRLSNPGKVMAVGFTRYPVIKAPYEKFSSVVHPRKGSYRLQLLGTPDSREGVTSMFLEIGIFEQHELKKYMTLLVDAMIDSFQHISSSTETLDIGEPLISGRAVKPTFTCIHWEPRTGEAT
jgi:hypothetical protein